MRVYKQIILISFFLKKNTFLRFNYKFLWNLYDNNNKKIYHVRTKLANTILLRPRPNRNTVITDDEN